MGVTVVEQNFEYDLASADALLKRYIERPVVCVDRDAKELYEGILLSYDAGSLTLADRLPVADPDAPRPKTQSIVRAKLQAVRLADVPKDLNTRPTLVWKLRAQRAGDQQLVLSYVCGQVEWQADYVAVVRPGNEGRDTLDLKGWVTIDNRSGSTYREAGIKLIAGEVNRVRDPWAPVPPPVTDYSHFFGMAVNAPGPSGPEEVRKELVQKDFFEYKLYALNLPSTVKDKQVKQLNLLSASGVRAARRFIFDPALHASRATTELVVENKKENRLGIPLPKGRVVFEGVDAEGETHFQGRDQLDHTPKDEELKLKLGLAFDLAGGYRVVSTRQLAEKRIVESCEFRLRNHRAGAADVRVVAHLTRHPTWQVNNASDPFKKHDSQTIHFEFRLPPNAEKTITYDVDYQW
jgi:hypothetical protein